MARYRAEMETNPERLQECKERQKLADKAYRAKNRAFLAFKKREKRKEIKAKKGQAQKDTPKEKRDYALEYAVWTCRKRDELQEKVADALWRDKDGYVMYNGQ
ncbi:hypothetical protein K438DRAFT_1747152 [Mycena galopus ATCC 62051]|nr:hypothetical protein K438DRAFT_1747152 [Mycena galopus ATCC 62051]